MEPIHPVTNKFFSDTDVILDTSPDSTDNNDLPTNLPFSELTQSL